jgi:hypothetical protein
VLLDVNAVPYVPQLLSAKNPPKPVWHPRCQIDQTNRNNVWCVWNCVKI